MFTLLIAFCDLPPLTVCVCFTAVMAKMTQSSLTTGWRFSCRRRRRRSISSETSRWAERWSPTSSDNLSTTRRRIRLSRCTSLQTPYRPFQDIHAKVLANRREQSTCLLDLAWTEASNLSCLKVRVSQVISWPLCYVSADVLNHRRGLCALIKLWLLLSYLQTEMNICPRG